MVSKDFPGDVDDSPLKILSMYRNKNHLRRNERVSNIAWRIRNRMLVRRNGGRALKLRKTLAAAKATSLDTFLKHVIAPPVSGSVSESTTNKTAEDFDYVAHIRRIFQEEYDLQADTKTTSPTLHNIVKSTLISALGSVNGYNSSTSSMYPQRMVQTSSKRSTAQSLYLDADPYVQQDSIGSSFFSSYINSIESTIKKDYKLSPGARQSSTSAAISSHYVSDKVSLVPPQANALECSNCHTKGMPLWRKTPQGDSLCNACWLFHKLHGSLRPANHTFPSRSQTQQTGQSSPARTSSPTTRLSTSSLSHYPDLIDGAMSSVNTGLFTQMGECIRTDDFLRFTSPSLHVSVGALTQVLFDLQPHDAFFGNEPLALLMDTPVFALGPDLQTSANTGTDDIDRLLDMELFTLDLFVIGRENVPGSEVIAHNFDVRGIKAADEVLIDEPAAGPNNWNWLDFGH